MFYRVAHRPAPGGTQHRPPVDNASHITDLLAPLNGILAVTSLGYYD
jgi:hypothetical protein